MELKEKYVKAIKRFFIFIRLFLIFVYIYVSIKSIFIRKIKEKKEQNYKYFFCFASMGRSENMYIKDIIDYYTKIGVDKFYIGDNNNKNEEPMSKVLKEYISKGLVEIIDITGIRKDQTDYFGDVYELHKSECKWMSFFDLDEYLSFRNQPNMTIQKYFSNPKFEKCNVIIINWVIYNDNNLIRYDNRSLNERFTHGIFNQDNNRFIKSIIRGNIYFKPWDYDQTSHRPNHHLRTCDSNGDRAKTFNDVLKPPKIDKIYLKHFVTKTVEEYLNKYKRGYTSRYLNLEGWIENFFSFNNVTKEKVKYLEDYFNITLEKYHFVFQK